MKMSREWRQQKILTIYVIFWSTSATEHCLNPTFISISAYAARLALVFSQLFRKAINAASLVF